MALELQFLGSQHRQLDQEMANLLDQHQDAGQAVGGGAGSRSGFPPSKRIIAKSVPRPATFPSEKQLSSWVGVCSGDDESAGVKPQATDHRTAPPYAAPAQSVRHAAASPKGASSILCIAARSRAWDIIQAIGRLPIDSVD